MPPKTPRSRLMGPARLDDGGTTTAYRALVEHTCGQCGRPIAPGALFSRRAVRSLSASLSPLTQAPVCAACRPLYLDGAQEGGPRRV